MKTGVRLDPYSTVGYAAKHGKRGSQNGNFPAEPRKSGFRRSQVPTMRKRSTLERQMLSYFGLIAAASLLITVEFVWALKIAMSESQRLINSSGVSENVGTAIITSLEVLRNKAFLMGVVQAVVTLIVLVMFIKRITGPLQLMVEESRHISDGDLSRTIGIGKRDEIGLMGETINGLTSNIQEIVAFGLSAGDAVRDPLEKLRKRVGNDSECQEQLDRIDEILGGFNCLLKDFTLLPAPLEERIKDKP